MSDAPNYDPYAITTEGIIDPPQSLWQALRKIGPGIILAGSIVGSGELIATTALGAEFGYILLWLILYSCVIKVFVQIELGRNAISSGKPTLSVLNELPGLRFGTNWLVWWWFFMLLCTVSQLGGMTGAVGQSLNIGFPGVSQTVASTLDSFSTQWGNAVRERPEYPWAFLTCFVAIILLRSGGYRRVETLTTLLVASVTLVTLVCVLALPATDHAPDLAAMFAGMIPSALPIAALGTALGAFGITGVGASELYSYPYWCLEKGYARYAGPREETEAWLKRAQGWLRVLYLDAWFSMVVFTIATVAFYIMGAAVLNPQNLHPKGTKVIEVLSEMYIGPFGKWTQIVFLIGAGLTLFKTLYVSSASHSRLVTDFFNLNGWVQLKQPSDRLLWINRLCIFFPVFALVLFIIFGDPKAMVIFGGIAQAMTLPIISGAAIFLRYRRTDPRLAPRFLSDICLWLAFVSITLVASYGIWSQVVKLF
jgi:manganese transport protein